MEETILGVHQYKHIYRTSHLFILTCLYGIFRGHYHAAIGPAAIFLTSLNHWRRPILCSYRRYLDIIVVRIGAAYHCYIAYNAQYAIIYYIIFSIGILSYIISCHFYDKKDYWKCTCFHIILHLMANLGTIVVYSG